MSERLLCEIAFILYGLANFSFLLHLGWNKRTLVVWATGFVILGAALHLGALIFRGFSLRQFPILDASDALGLLAVLILLIYFVLQWKWALPGLGFFATCLAFLFTLISLSYPPQLQKLPSSNLTGAALEVHVAAIILSFGLLALAFCSSVAYLAQDFMLHGKRLVNFSKRLPPLDTLDFLTNRLVSLGFVLLSIGIFFGSIWAEREWGRWWSRDPKFIGAALTWLIYAIYIYSRTLSGWKGRRSVMLIILGFLLVLATFLGTNFFPGRHRFV